MCAKILLWPRRGRNKAYSSLAWIAKLDVVRSSGWIYCNVLGRIFNLPVRAPVSFGVLFLTIARSEKSGSNLEWITDPNLDIVWEFCFPDRISAAWQNFFTGLFNVEYSLNLNQSKSTDYQWNLTDYFSKNWLI